MGDQWVGRYGIKRQKIDGVGSLVPFIFVIAEFRMPDDEKDLFIWKSIFPPQHDEFQPDFSVETMSITELQGLADSMDNGRTTRNSVCQSGACISIENVNTDEKTENSWDYLKILLDL